MYHTGGGNTGTADSECDWDRFSMWEDEFEDFRDRCGRLNTMFEIELRFKGLLP